MRKRSSIIKELQKIWGENWVTNMEIIANHQMHHYDDIELPLSQIEASNKLILELQKIEMGEKA